MYNGFYVFFVPRTTRRHKSFANRLTYGCKPVKKRWSSSCLLMRGFPLLRGSSVGSDQIYHNSYLTTCFSLSLFPLSSHSNFLDDGPPNGHDMHAMWWKKFRPTNTPKSLCLFARNMRKIFPSLKVLVSQTLYLCTLNLTTDLGLNV